MPIDTYQEATNAILNALEKGTVPWRHPLLGGGQDTMPKNLNTGKTYRGINLFLLALAGWSSGYESPWWLTYKQARDRGGHIRKGEKSTTVIFWKELTVTDEETGKPKKIPVLRHYNAFNACQTEDVAYPAIEQPEVAFEPLEQAEQLVTGYSGAPAITHGGSRACYSPLTDQVHIPAPERFVDRESYYTTLFHELAHSTGHSSRLDRGLDTKLAPFGTPTYAKEELVAEFAAAGLSAATGIAPAVVDNSAAYIAGWLKALKSDKKLVVHAAGAGQKAVDWIAGQRQSSR